MQFPQGYHGTKETNGCHGSPTKSSEVVQISLAAISSGLAERDKDF